MGHWDKETFKREWKNKQTTDFWIKEWKERYAGYKTEFKMILNVLKKIEWESLVEVGCGVGKNLEMIDKKFKNKILIGYDINEEFLSRNKGFVLNQDTEHLKLKKRVDVIMSYEHLQHLHPDAYKNAVDRIKENCKYVLIYEGYKEKVGVIKSGSGGRWAHNYEKDFGGEIVYKKIIEHNSYILLIIKLN